MKRFKKLISLLTAVSMLTCILPTSAYALEPIPPDAYDPTLSGQGVLDGLMDAFRPADENYMYSPFSIKTALALAANGADEKTKAALLEVIGTDSIEEYNERALSLVQKYSGDTNVVLNSANSLWINTDQAPNTTFNKDYTELVKKFFNAQTGTVTNANAVETVNGWCSDNTNEKIKEIIDDSSFSAIIANALYFKGDWDKPFEELATRKGIFTDRNGRKAEIDFMQAEDTYGFYEDDNIKILELDYKGRDTAMYLVLDKGARTDIIPYMDSIKQENVEIKIPKFKIEYFNSYAFPSSFRQLAAFPNLFEGSDYMELSELRHKTYINVDEYGTEAAAVTVLIWEGAVMDPAKFIADEPFEFYIVDKAEKEVLFAGEYAYADEENYIEEQSESTTEQSTESSTESTTEPSTEHSTEPTTEEPSYDPTTDDIKAEWYEYGIAVWPSGIDEEKGIYNGEYLLKLFKDGIDGAIDTRTVTAEYLGPAYNVKNCAVDLSRILSEYGEGIYRYNVTYNYGKPHDYENMTLLSTDFFYSGKKFDEENSALFSEDMTDYIAAVGRSPIPAMHECEYRISNLDMLDVYSDVGIYEAYSELSPDYKAADLSSYRQLIFIPKKAGIVTIRLDQTLQADGTVLHTDECTYIIDENLKAYVYKPSKGYLAGDADNDGKLTAADSANVLQKALVSTFETPVELVDKENYLVTEGNTVYDRAAVMDINKNGSIDADDAARILQTVLTGV